MNDCAALPSMTAEQPAAAMPDEEEAGAAALRQFLETPLARQESPQARSHIDGALVGTLVGFLDLSVPLVVFPGQPGAAAIAARSTLDLRGEHIGSEVVLVFEEGDLARPIVTGKLQKPAAWPLAEEPAQVEVDADGQRLTLVAKEQLILKCGKASITLTKAGKVLIQGAYVSNRSSGVMRIKGGSVQIN